MTENNFNEVEVQEVQKDKEEVIGTSSNNINLSEASIGQKNSVGSSFMKYLIGKLIDEAIIGVISVIILYIIDAVLRLFGYNVSEKVSMLFIIFIVISILYTSIMENSNSGRTAGKRLLNI